MNEMEVLELNLGRDARENLCFVDDLIPFSIWDKKHKRYFLAGLRQPN